MTKVKCQELQASRVDEVLADAWGPLGLLPSWVKRFRMVSLLGVGGHQGKQENSLKVEPGLLESRERLSSDKMD